MDDKIRTLIEECAKRGLDSLAQADDDILDAAKNILEDCIEAINASGTHRVVEVAEIERKDAQIADLIEEINKTRECARKYQERLAGVDAGTHVIVLKEATKDMETAGVKRWLELPRAMLMTFVFREVYRAMIAAAPAEGEKE